MIIAISGKLGSGKDTVGHIIQYLTSNYFINGESFDEYLEDVKKRNDYPLFLHWQVKKFADKLKDIVCILLGCTREQLEDRDFKEKELGEEWTKYYLYHYKFPNKTINGYYNTELEALEDKQRNTKFEKFGISRGALDIGKIELTPRLLLQLLGTECGRDIIHPSIWINSLFSTYKKETTIKTRVNGTTYKDKESQWVITDLRFKNEYEEIKRRGGVTIKILRDIDKKSTHSSEIDLDKQEFDYTIVNDGTILDLIEKVKKILLEDEKIYSYLL